MWEQVENLGWENLSNADCGRVGGIMRNRIKQQRLKQEQEHNPPE
ncbi:MAG: hypothetical protein PHF24_05605 [Syntrophomonas sp.]|nr:hypothetical protein [Syntrophomonas sp.]